MTSTNYGITNGSRTFTADFAELCSPEVNGAPAGCAMFTIEFFGGDDRVVSIYDFQPSLAPAFSNTLFLPKAMKRITQYPPTKLIQVSFFSLAHVLYWLSGIICAINIRITILV
jgi:hypothetical protein